MKASTHSILVFQSVSPGPVETEFADASNLMSNQNFKEVYSSLPKLSSEDVADAVVYALSTPPHVQVSWLKDAFNKIIITCFLSRSKK